MKNLIYETGCGDNFHTVAKKSKEWSSEKNMKVEFDFNGVTCIVSKDTNLEWLYRDYCNAHLMEWKVVGSDCLSEYEPSVQAELDNRNELSEEEHKQEQIEYKAKWDEEKKVFEEKVKGIEIELKDVAGWKKSREANTDPYGKATMDYAEGWAKLMQAEAKKKGYTTIDFVVLSGIAEKTSHELGFMGITGFMYGAAVATLSQCWKHGEALRKWHNKEYGHEGDGVVNPAVLSI